MAASSENSDRLSNLHLMPPLASGVWGTNQLHGAAQSFKRADEVPVKVVLPLFWYDPQWIRLPTTVAAALAAAVANLDVVVSALRRDLCEGDETAELFLPVDDEQQEETGSTRSVAASYLPRMTPYRAERYGFSPTDFDDARVIDFRFNSARDVSGRMAYSPQQMQRWEQGQDQSLIAGGGYVASGTFPTDVVSLKQARTKLDQIRRLAPTAGVFVSIDAYRLDEEVNAALVANPDGMILRMDSPDFEGLQVAGLVRRARELMDQSGASGKPLWVVPGEVSARDVAKLVALGATGVAIDSWCNPLVDFLLESMPDSRYEPPSLTEIPVVASEHLWDEIDQVIGLISSINPDATISQRLGTYHQRWAKATGASLLLP